MSEPSYSDRAELPFEDFESLLDYGVKVIDNLGVAIQSDVNVEEIQIVVADAMKTFAGEYARLLSEGLVPQEHEYKPNENGGQLWEGNNAN